MVIKMSNDFVPGKGDICLALDEENVFWVLLSREDDNFIFAKINKTKIQFVYEMASGRYSCSTREWLRYE